MIFVAILAFLVAVVFFVIYVVQMHRTKKQYLGKNAVEQIAKNAARAALKNETKITCDYCGFVIDTKIHKVCPQCGASYGTDQEWQGRREVDQAQMDQKIQDGIQRNKNTVKRLNANRMKKATFLIIAISAFIVFAVAIVLLAFGTKTVNLNRSEEVREGYVKANYAFTDPVVIDNEDLTVELGDIYYRDDSYLEKTQMSYMIEVRIQNHTGKNGKLTIYAPAANNRCIPEILYESVGYKNEIIRFLDIPSYYLGDEYLKKIVLNNIRFMDKQYNEVVNIPEFLTFETDADMELEPAEPIGDVLFEKNGLIFSIQRTDEDYWFYVTNTSQQDFGVRTYASLVNGKTDKLWVDGTIPSGCRDEANILSRIHLDEEEELSEIKIQLECNCYSAPQESFVTDYIELPVN